MDRKLKSATFLLKYDCNLNCSFCLNDWRGKKRPNDELTWAQQKETLQKLKKEGVEHVTFTGGEPTLHPNLAELIVFASELGLSTLLQTNGTRIDDEFLKKVKGKLNGIQISLEGMREEQKKISKVDCFDRIVANMRKIKQNGFRLFTNFTITQQNKSSLKQYLALLNDIGVDVASFTRLYPAGQAIKNWQELVVSAEEYASFIRELKELEKSSKTKIYLAGPTDTSFLLQQNLSVDNKALCSAGRGEIAINPNGDILPCPSWNKPAGNIAKQDLHEVWNKSFLKVLGNSHDGKQGCMLARANGMDELEPARLDKASVR